MALGGHYMKKAVALALTTIFVMACTSADDPNRRTKTGAATGAAVGAVVGGVVGNQSGNPRTGAAVGAAVGAGVGAAIGRRMDNQQRELQQIEGIEVTRTAEDELNVVVRNDVLFDTDSAALRTASRNTLQEMAGVFNRYTDTYIYVEGHADSTGADDYNMTLSQRRADSVKDFLRNQGISGSRIVATGYGERQPRSTNDTPDGRQSNRRVEIHVKAIPQQG
jgi:outer membrane protein OmpA-like peptidoglycan-associated protein